MKKVIKVFTLGLIAAVMFSACSKDDTLSNQEESNEMEASETSVGMRNITEDAQVVVMAAPSIYNTYYSSVFQDIVDFQVQYANEVEGRDAAIILVNNDTRPYYEGRVPSYVLVEGDMEDIWIRDFGATIAEKQVKFRFSPDYMSLADSRAIERAYKRWMRKNDLPFGKISNLILDGGNVVDNGKGKVIVTDRVLYDNPHFTKKQIKQKLKSLMGASEVAVIKESPGDVTGHADGIAMWATENKILLHEQEPLVHDKIIKELESSFPGVEIVVLDDHFVYDEWEGFGTSCNIFVNSLVTNNFIYVPTFNMGVDQEMLDVIQSHTDKTVVEIPAENVCFMGGSVRCLTWNVDGEMADWLLTE